MADPKKLDPLVGQERRFCAEYVRRGHYGQLMRNLRLAGTEEILARYVWVIAADALDGVPPRAKVEFNARVIHFAREYDRKKRIFYHTCVIDLYRPTHIFVNGCPLSWLAEGWL